MADRYKITKNDYPEETRESSDILDEGMTWFDNAQAKPVPSQHVFFKVENKFFWGRYRYGPRKWSPTPDIEGLIKNISDNDVSCWAPLPVVGGIESKEVRHYASLVQENYIKLAREYFEKILSSFDILDYICIKGRNIKKLSVAEMDEQDRDEQDPIQSGPGEPEINRPERFHTESEDPELDRLGSNIR